MKILRELTAASLSFGPFVDSTDGVTPETGLVLSAQTIRIQKNGGAWADKNASDAAVHKENGWYGFNLSVVDVNTCGIMQVAAYTTGALPVWDVVLVLASPVYDSLVLGSDRLQVDVREKGDSTLALTTQEKSDVNAEVVDVLRTDTNSELSSLPGASPTIAQLLMFLYEIARNKVTTTGSQQKLYKDDGSTVLGTWSVSDDGVTFTKGEIA